MAVPLALPLAPVIVSTPAATAAAATFVIGSTLHLADTLYGFRRSVPTLPPLTGLEGVATLQEMVADALAGARVPVGFPLPPPWRPEGSALGLAATSLGLWSKLTEGLAQLWGLFGTSADLPPGYEPPTSTKYTAGFVTRPPGGAGGFAVSYTSPDILPNPTSFTTPASVVMLRIEREYFEDKPWPGTTGWAYMVWGYNEAGEQIYGRAFLMGYAAGMVLWDGPLTPNLRLESVNFTAMGSEGTYVPRDLEPIPDLPPARDVEVLPAVAPAPLPLPLPATVPQVVPSTEPDALPAPSPLVPVTPGPVAPPIVQPATPISPQQPKVPAPTATNNGTVIAPAPAPVPTTDPGSVVPWPGADPIPGTGLAPAPTLEGIAQEVGRIERKIEVMMTPDAPGNLIDQFGDLADLIGPIVEAILAATSGTVYTLDSPCEVDGDGVRLPAVEVEAPGALTQFGAILNRVDALAELLQVHKDLKQPNCRGADVPVGGEFVTVNFEQID